VIAGVEGSHLVHGVMLMPPGARALVVQPPGRAVSALKRMTDRQGQDYSLVVGVGTNEAFHADPGEIERTLDLR
jgi:capsular polysaccharide biosynthesis protein